MPRSRLALLSVVTVLVAGCAVGRFETGGAEPQVPDWPLETIAGRPTGPVHVLATGLTEEAGWRYSVYESADGLCFEIELDQGNSGAASGGCGFLRDEPTEPITQVGAGSASGGVVHVTGVARADVAELRLRSADGRSLPAELIALDELGYEEQAFVVIAPPGMVPSDLVAVDADGDDLGTADVPGSGTGAPNDDRPQPPETTSSAS